MAMFPIDNDSDPPDPEALKELVKKATKELFTINGVERAIKQAVKLCWMIQPKERRTAEHVEAVIRHAVDWVLSDLKKDPKEFGVLDLPPFAGPAFFGLDDD